MDGRKDVAAVSNESSMTPQEYQFVKEILLQVYGLDKDKQLIHVQNACKSNPVLMQPIMEMLEMGHSGETKAMDQPAIIKQMPELDSQPVIDEPPLANGSLVSHYTVIEKIGSGGMGNVYAAQQRSPAERIVALKILKKNPNQQQLISETQILAQLNHPNISTLFEVDQTEDGQLFISMEMVDGGDIISWCKDHHCDINQSIELFQQLCTGISYAHQKGIIHCDIKPSNVLIAEINGIATVKIIDFGISRFENKQYSKNKLAGTPAYLAPEILSNQDTNMTDTRRDIYSLGVLLKKLLPMTIPFQLQAIVNKAMAHDKENRYSTANGISHDLNRYFKKLPVSAIKHAPHYLAKLFMQRNLGAVLFAAILLMSLIGGFVAQYRQANIATQQAQVARVAQTEAEELSAFLTEMFDTANPERNNSSVITTDDLLHKAQLKLMAIVNPTLSDARFMHTIGSIYTRMEKLKNAKGLIIKSLQIKQSKLSKTHPEVVIGLSQLGLIYKKLDDYEQSEKHLKLGIDALLSQPKIDSIQLSTNYNILGNLYIETEQLDKAIVQHKLAIGIRQQGDDIKALADSYNNLGVIYNNAKKWSLASDYYYLALNIYEKEYEPHHPFIAVTKNNLAYIEEQKFNWEKSEDLLKDAWVSWQYAYGENHSNTITAQRNLALFYDRRMRYPKAIELFNLMIESFKKNQGIEKQAKYMSLMALSYAHMQNFKAANKLHEEAIDLLKDHSINEKYLYAKLRTQYAKTLVLQEDYAQAEKVLNQALENLSKNYAEDNYYRLYTTNLLADNYYRKKDYGRANSLFLKVLAHSDSPVVRIQLRQITAQIGIGRIFSQQNKMNEFHEAFNKALQANQLIYGDQHKTNAIVYFEIAKIQIKQNNSIQAKKLLEQALVIQKLVLPSQHKNLLATVKLLETL